MTNDKSRPCPSLRRWLCLLCALVLALGALPLSALAQSQAKVVRVGYYENEVFQEGAGEGKIRTGYAYEYYQKLSEYTGWRYQYVYDSYSRLYQMLLDGSIDVLAGLARTPEREGIIGYPDSPMGSETYSLLKHSSDESLTSDPATLEGKQIGVLDSVIARVLNEYLDSRGVKAQVSTFSDYQDLFAAFDQDKLDVLAAEGDGARGREGAEVLCPFGSSDYYLCVCRFRQDLLRELNSAQTRLAVEEPNFIPSLQAKYYRQSISSRAFSAEERQWLDTHQSLTVGYLKHYLPYSDTDKQGEVTGLVRDLVSKMLSEMDITHLEVAYTGFESYQDMIKAMARGDIDAAFPVGGGLYYCEENGICQSTPVISPTMELVYRGDYKEDLTSHFAVNSNNLMQYYYIVTHYPESRISYYDGIDACLDAVRSGAANCTVVNELRSHSLMRSSRNAALSQRQLSDRADRCFGVTIGNEGLLKLLNRGVSVVGEDYASNLAYQYVDDLFRPNLTDIVLAHWQVFAFLALFILCLVVSFLVHDFHSSEVRRRMRERYFAKPSNGRRNNI